MKIEPGMRVRCVVPDELVGLFYGDEHVVFSADIHARTGKYRIWVDDGRFKPVVRVKAGVQRTGKAFDVYVKRAVAAFNALPPERQQAMQLEQRDSWVRGEMGLAKRERRYSSRTSPFEP